MVTKLQNIDYELFVGETGLMLFNILRVDPRLKDRKYYKDLNTDERLGKFGGLGPLGLDLSLSIHTDLFGGCLCLGVRPMPAYNNRLWCTNVWRTKADADKVAAKIHAALAEWDAQHVYKDYGVKLALNMLMGKYLRWNGETRLKICAHTESIFGRCVLMVEQQEEPGVLLTNADGDVHFFDSVSKLWRYVRNMEKGVGVKIFPHEVMLSSNPADHRTLESQG